MADADAPAACLVTGLVTAYNAEPFVEQAVRSLLAQEMPGGEAFEVVAVDDGSSDGTGELLDRLAATDARLRVLRPGRLGRVAALNLGLAEARGRYVAILDADDIALPGRFARQAAYLDAHPAVAQVGSAVQIVTTDGTPVRVQTDLADDEAIRRKLKEGAAFTHSALMVRADAARAAGGYRRPFPPSEDYDLQVRLAERHASANLADVLVQYRVHENQLSSRQVRRQLLTGMAIRASAEARAQGRPDPADGAAELDEALLARLGLAGEATQRLLDEQVMVRAWLMMRDGGQAGGRAMLDELWQTRGPAVERPGELRARISFALARGYWLGGRRLRAAGHLAKALLRRPRFVGEVAGAAARRLRGRD